MQYFEGGGDDLFLSKKLCPLEFAVGELWPCLYVSSAQRESQPVDVFPESEEEQGCD